MFVKNKQDQNEINEKSFGGRGRYIVTDKDGAVKKIILEPLI